MTQAASVCVCSAQGSHSTYRCLFQNSQCVEELGTARSQQEYLHALEQMSEDSRQAWFDWTARVTVCFLTDYSCKPDLRSFITSLS